MEGNLPDGLYKNSAFTQAVVAAGNVKTVYVGGQDAVDTAGAIVGKGDLKAQTEQVLENLETALAAGGAKLEHVVKWNVYLVQRQSPLPGFESHATIMPDVSCMAARDGPSFTCPSP